MLVNWSHSTKSKFSCLNSSSSMGSGGMSLSQTQQCSCASNVLGTGFQDLLCARTASLTNRLVKFTTTGDWCNVISLFHVEGTFEIVLASKSRENRSCDGSKAACWSSPQGVSLYWMKSCTMWNVDLQVPQINMSWWSGGVTLEQVGWPGWLCLVQFPFRRLVSVRKVLMV